MALDNRIFLIRLGAGNVETPPLSSIGQSAAFGPLTAAGVTGAPREHAGAAAGLVNVAHPLGASPSLSILITVFPTAGSHARTANDQLTERTAAGLSGGAVMLAVALLLVLV